MKPITCASCGTAQSAALYCARCGHRLESVATGADSEAISTAAEPGAMEEIKPESPTTGPHSPADNPAGSIARSSLAAGSARTTRSPRSVLVAGVVLGIIAITATATALSVTHHSPSRSVTTSLTAGAVGITSQAPTAVVSTGSPRRPSSHARATTRKGANSAARGRSERSSAARARGAIRAVVLADAAGVARVPSYNGPARDIFSVTQLINVGATVRVDCTLYGQPVTAQGGTGRLWDHTNRGWLSDQLVDTGSAEPVAPACNGTAARPHPGANAPSRTLGPFVVVGSVAARAQPAAVARVVRHLRDGQLVLISCAVRRGRVIAPPPRLRNAGGNNAWDLLSAVGGWTPDSYVASYTSGPAAPAC